jgi:hypothetical protein
VQKVRSSLRQPFAPPRPGDKWHMDEVLIRIQGVQHFGSDSAVLGVWPAFVAVLACGFGGGLAGGLFSAALLRAASGLSGRAGRLLMHYPVVFAGMCGLGIAAIGVASGGQTYGTGYE